MDVRTKELVDFTQKKFGLTNYYLKDYSFYRKVNMFNETVYTLSMEWLPQGMNSEDDDLNPKGTASIELNINNRKFEQVIFVEGKTYSENSIKFHNKEEIIKWIESETGLTYEEQFQMEKEEEGKIIFQSYIDGVKVSPLGDIELKFDKEGKLILFSIYGYFPSKEDVQKEKFALSLESFEPLMKEQIKLIQFPIFEEKKILPIYAVEEIFITNDGTTTIPIDFYSKTNNYLKLNETIYWDEPIKSSFERKLINLNEDITEEQAFSCEPSPDSIPISKEELEKTKIAVKNLLQQEYPNESGNWVLKNLYRENGYIVATLKAQTQSNFVFQRKIQVFINSKNFFVENYMDSKEFLKTFDDFQVENEINCTKEKAFEKLKSYFKLTPTYVYDDTQKQYVLCGKLDCPYAVNASNGEIVSLDKM